MMAEDPEVGLFVGTLVSSVVMDHPRPTSLVVIEMHRSLDRFAPLGSIWKRLVFELDYSSRPNHTHNTHTETYNTENTIHTET